MHAELNQSEGQILSDHSITRGEFLKLFSGMGVMAASLRVASHEMSQPTDIMFGHNVGSNILTVKDLILNFVNADSVTLAKYYRSFFPAVAWRCDIDVEGFDRIPYLIELDAMQRRKKTHSGASRFGSEIVQFSEKEADELKVNIHRAKAIAPIAACHRQLMADVPSRAQTLDIIRAGIENDDAVVGEITCQNLVTSLIKGSATQNRARSGHLYAQSTEHLYQLIRYLADRASDPNFSQVFMHALIYLQNAKAICEFVGHELSAKEIETSLQTLRSIDYPHLQIAIAAAGSFKYTDNLDGAGLCPQTYETVMSWENHIGGTQKEYLMWSGLKHLQVLYQAYCDCDESQLAWAPENRGVEELKVWKLIAMFRATGYFNAALRPRLTSTGPGSLHEQLSFDRSFRDFVFDKLPQIIDDEDRYKSEHLSESTLQEGRMISQRWPSSTEFLSPYDPQCIIDARSEMAAQAAGKSSLESVSLSMSKLMLSGLTMVGAGELMRPATVKLAKNAASPVEVPADVNDHTAQFLRAFSQSAENSSTEISYSSWR